MKFNACTRITWSSLELTGLLEDEDSHVHFEKIKKHLGLHPFHLTNLQQALNEILSASLNIYDTELKGFLIAYKNPKLLTPLGEILYDTCYIHVDVEVDFYVFRPQVDHSLKGIVNKKGLGHIGLLVHKAFNVSIPKPEGSDDWPGDKVETGQEVRCTITHLDYTSKLPFIRGQLNAEDYLYGCTLFKGQIDDDVLEDESLSNNECETNAQTNESANEQSIVSGKSSHKGKKRPKKSKTDDEVETEKTISNSKTSFVNTPENYENIDGTLNNSDKDENRLILNNMYDKEQNKSKLVSKRQRKSKLSDNGLENNTVSSVLQEECSQENLKRKRHSLKDKIASDADDTQPTIKTPLKKSKPLIKSSPFTVASSKSNESLTVNEFKKSSHKKQSRETSSPDLQQNITAGDIKPEMAEVNNISNLTKKRSKKSNLCLPGEDANSSLQNEATSIQKQKSRKTRYSDFENNLTNIDFKLEEVASNNTSVSSKKRSKKSTLLNADDNFAEGDVQSAQSFKKDLSSSQNSSNKANKSTGNRKNFKIKEEQSLTNGELENGFTDVRIKFERLSQESSGSPERPVEEFGLTNPEGDYTNVKSEESSTNDALRFSKKQYKKSTSVTRNNLVEPTTNSELPAQDAAASKKKAQRSSLLDAENFEVSVKSELNDELSSSKKRSKRSETSESGEQLLVDGSGSPKKRRRKSKSNNEEENLANVTAEETAGSDNVNTAKKRSQELNLADLKEYSSGVKIKSEKPSTSDESDFASRKSKKSTAGRSEDQPTRIESKSSNKRSRNSLSPDASGKLRKSQTQLDKSSPKGLSSGGDNSSFTEVRIKKEKSPASDEFDTLKKHHKKSSSSNHTDYPAGVRIKTEPLDDAPVTSRKRTKTHESQVTHDLAEVTVKAEKHLAEDSATVPKKRAKKSKSITASEDFTEVQIKSEN